MKTTRLILVGGFLGAGKTSLLWESAHLLMRKGNRIGLITNDQASELVDTALLSRDEIKVAEVSGSCFCCNFNELIRVMRHVRDDASADVIIAEPVGSCTDLSATIIQPLKDSMSNELVLSPLSVMADPMRLNDILKGGTAGLHPSAAYIFRKQLEESDIILISKSDLLSSDELEKLKDRVNLSYPESDVMTLSSMNGNGIEEWLTEVLNRTDSGSRLVDVDYDVYAEGEAVLGWLNSTMTLNGRPTDWDRFARSFMQELSQQFDNRSASVGHVKMMIENGNQYLIANLTGENTTLNFRKSAGIGIEGRLTLNARVEMNPETLEQIVMDVLHSYSDQFEIKVLSLKCLKPGRPDPTFRFAHIVPML